jgi:uncharacterized membrane protein YedE/YeeE
MMKQFAALGCGTLFGVGLAMSGMTDVAKVIGFLDITGHWDPTLAFVMGGGLLVSLPFFQLGLGKLSHPLFSDTFRVPTRNDIDLPLIAGAILFGVGWGLVGFCPGPAIASLGYLNPDILYFTLAMIAGMFASNWLEGLIKKS